jgi:hypothetical protein
MSNFEEGSMQDLMNSLQAGIKTIHSGDIVKGTVICFKGCCIC